MPEFSFSRSEDVDRFVARYGVAALRDLARTETMRSSSQYHAVAWLAGYDRDCEREARAIWQEIKASLQEQILV